jgi:hypothetical protein
MRVDGKLVFVSARSMIPCVPPPAAISRERSFFDPAMNSSFLKRLQRRRLCMGQSRFRAALGKSPAPAATRANQQELDSTLAHPVANRGHLLAFAQFAKLR